MGRIVRAAGGGVLFAAALALSLSGVTPVRADPAPKSGLAEGPMCRANAPLTSPTVIADVTNQLNARARAEATPGQPQIRVLNTQGYRYDPDRMRVDLRELAREVALERRRQAPRPH